MNILFVIFSLVLGAGVLGACSKQVETSTIKSNAEKSIHSQATPKVAPDPVQKNETQIAIEQAANQLKNPNLHTQINGVRELRRTYSPEACHILVLHLKEKELQLPSSLDSNEASEVGLLVEYIGALLQEIRIMDQPEGNEAVAGFIKSFRTKYGREKLGQTQLATFESQLKNAEQDVRAGIYGKGVKPLQGLTN